MSDSDADAQATFPDAPIAPAAPVPVPRRRRRRRRKPSGPPRRSKLWAAREVATALLLAPLALWLAWRVFTMGLADQWATSDPDLALQWRPSNSVALVAAGDLAINRRDFKDSDALARRAIAAYPLDGGGYRLLAGEKSFFGHDEAAKQLLAISVSRSPRDVVARSMVLQYAMKDRSWPEALHQFDVMLRIRPDMAGSLMPRLVAAASVPMFGDLIDKLLVSRPPWRQAFLQLLASNGADQDAVDRVFAGRGGNDPLLPPAVGTESDLLVDRQIADGRLGAAYFTWASALSNTQRARLGNVFDGSFDFPPSNRGFDWRFPDKGTGFDVLIASAGDLTSNNVLRLTFNGLPLDYRPVQQLVILGSGHYRLSGLGGASGVDTEDGGPVWTLTCVGGSQQTVATTTPFSGDIPWGPFHVDFDVPESPDCAAQWLRLDMKGGTLFVGDPLHGTVAFDDLRIDRLDTDSVVEGQSAPAATATAPKPVDVVRKFVKDRHPAPATKPSAPDKPGGKVPAKNKKR